uniref:Uncharacterized protein n=1 Tax=Anopheles funestus TaxID=62324 RepID=A0A182R567_ANOFN
MIASKSKTADRLTAEKLHRIIKNIRNASSILSTSEDTDVGGCDQKLDANNECCTLNVSQLKISHRKLTVDEIDKIMKNLSTTSTPSGEPDRPSTVDSEMQQVKQEAPSVSEIQYVESEISFTSYDPSAGTHSALELLADVEDNLAYSDESLLSFSGNDDDQSDRTNVRLHFSPGSAASWTNPSTLFAFRTIELTASEEYESYGETSSSVVDRPIMQVKVRPLPASHAIRTGCLRVQPSDDERPLIDFRQIERNTKAASWKHRDKIGKSSRHQGNFVALKCAILKPQTAGE